MESSERGVSPPESQQVAEFRAAASLLIERIQWMRQHGITFKGDRDLYEVLGYDRVLKAKDYRDRYARGGIAGRVVDALPNATWRGGVELIEDEDPENETPFEKAWADLDKRLKIVPVLRRTDILAGQGRYAILLIGAPGELNTELPKGRPEKLLYLTPFSEDDATITKWEVDPANPRFGLPLEYMLRRMDITSMAFTKPVHWSRCIHIAEGCLDNDVFGAPALERIWNLLDDLEKVTGGGAEAFWLRANQGLQIDIDKDMELSEPARAALASEVEQYRNNISRVMKTRGTTVNTLGSDTANFSNPADSILTQIAGSKAIPKRVLTGSEMGELASSQDRDNWKDQINGRQTGYAGPFIVRPLVDRLIEFGYLPRPGVKPMVKKTPGEKIKPGEKPVDEPVKTKPNGEPVDVPTDEKKKPPFVKAAAAKIKLVNDKEIETARPLAPNERGLSPENQRAYEDEQRANGVQVGVPTKDDPLNEDGTTDTESLDAKNEAADYEVRWAHMQTLTESEKAEGAKNWAATTSGEGPVFTRSEIRDKWYQLPPLTDEQLLEMTPAPQAQPLLDDAGQPVLDENGQPVMMDPNAPPPAAGGEDITSVLDAMLGDTGDPSQDPSQGVVDETVKPKGKFPFKAAGGEGSGVAGHQGAFIPGLARDRAVAPTVPGAPQAGRSFAHPTPQAAQATVKKAEAHLRKKGFKIGPSLAGSAGVTITPFSLGNVSGQIKADQANTVSVSLLPVAKTRSAAEMLVDGMGIKVGDPQPEVKRKYSSTQVNLPVALADKIRAIGQQIPDGDLGDDGREDHPHVTIKWGLHTNDPQDVERLLTDATPIELTLGPLALFQHDDYDVLFATVYSPYMRELNALISGRLQVTDTHPFYAPHATIAYLKPGLGKKYVNDPELNTLNGEKATIDEVIFSDTEKRFTPIRLRGELKAAEAEPEEEELSAEELGVVEYLEHMFTETGAEWSLVPREDGKFDVLLARPEAAEPPPAPVINIHPPNIIVNQPDIRLTVPVHIPKPGVKTFEYGMVDGKMRPVGVKEQEPTDE